MFSVSEFNLFRIDSQSCIVLKLKLTMNTKTVPYVPFKVKDMSLASWGRKEIELAEAEMPAEEKQVPAEE